MLPPLFHRIGCSPSCWHDILGRHFRKSGSVVPHSCNDRSNCVGKDASAREGVRKGREGQGRGEEEEKGGGEVIVAAYGVTTDRRRMR